MTPDDAKALLAALPARIDAEVGTGLGTVADTAATETRRLLGEAVHRPSPPGAPPADLAGAMAGAVTTVAADGAAQVVVAIPFAHDLEYGTQRMAARPFLRPAVAGTADEARSTLADALSRAIALALDDTA